MKVSVVKSGELLADIKRVDANYYLSPGVLSAKHILNSPYELQTLNKFCKNIFNGGRYKRVYVEDPQKGFELWGITDVLKSQPEGNKRISKKFTRHYESLLVNEGWILVARSGSGAIGTAAYATKDFNDKIISEDLLRIVPKNEKQSGYLYAFLASKYGHSLLQKGIYGTAIPHIEPDYVQGIQIPILPARKRQTIHELIEDASQMRVEANRLIRNSIGILEDKLPSTKFEKIYAAKISSRRGHGVRIEATYNTNAIENFYKEIKKLKVELKSIGDVSKEVFTPGIFKRLRTDKSENGIPFLSGSDLLSQMPQMNTFLSKKMKNLDDYLLKEGWLAIQDSGTIGYVSYINKFIDGVSATNNLVRVIPNKKDNYNPYVYCFLKTEIGQQLLRSLEYGSVQKHIDTNQVSNFRVPIFTDVFEPITQSIKKAMKKFGDACFLEKDALEIIEKEIESWQK
jgi:type I restriction enzyme S subunit